MVEPSAFESKVSRRIIHITVTVGKTAESEETECLVQVDGVLLGDQLLDNLSPTTAESL